MVLNLKEIACELERSWNFSRGMTMDYVNCVPENFWNFTPHEKYSPLAKQFRHMIWVTGLYRDAIENQSMKPFSTKKTHYHGGLSKQEILEGFEKQNKEMIEALNRVKQHDEYSVKAFGSQMSISEFGHVILQHESNHHGLWSLYAKIAGFSSPSSWSDNWGL